MLFFFQHISSSLVLSDGSNLHVSIDVNVISMLKRATMGQWDKVLSIHGHLPLVLVEQDQDFGLGANLEWEVMVIALLGTPAATLAVGADDDRSATAVRVVPAHAQVELNVVRAVQGTTVLHVDHKSAMLWHKSNLKETTGLSTVRNWHADRHARVLQLVTNWLIAVVIADSLNLHLTLELKATDFLQWQAMGEVESRVAIDANDVFIMKTLNSDLKRSTFLKDHRSVSLLIAPATVDARVAHGNVLGKTRVDVQSNLARVRE